MKKQIVKKCHLLGHHGLNTTRSPSMGQDSGPQKAQQAHKHSSARLGPEAYNLEESNGDGGAGLINRSCRSSASEVGLNIPPHRGFGRRRPLVPVGSTNRD